MNPGFQQTKIRCWTGDGLNDVIVDNLDYLSEAGTLYRVPAGGTTDGLSVPRAVQNLIPASGDSSWMAGVLHDSAYRNQLLVWDGSAYICASLQQAQADTLILEAMKSQGVGFVRRWAIYGALRAFGAKAFAENRSPAGILRNRLVQV